MQLSGPEAAGLGEMCAGAGAPDAAEKVRAADAAIRAGRGHQPLGLLPEQPLQTKATLNWKVLQLPYIFRKCRFADGFAVRRTKIFAALVGGATDFCRVRHA